MARACKTDSLLSAKVIHIGDSLSKAISQNVPHLKTYLCISKHSFRIHEGRAEDPLVIRRTPAWVSVAPIVGSQLVLHEIHQISKDPNTGLLGSGNRTAPFQEMILPMK